MAAAEAGRRRTDADAQRQVAGFAYKRKGRVWVDYHPGGGEPEEYEIWFEYRLAGALLVRLHLPVGWFTLRAFAQNILEDRVDHAKEAE